MLNEIRVLMQQQAFEAVRAQLAQWPEDMHTAESWFYLAVAAQQLQAFAQAEAAFKASLTLNPNSVPARQNLGLLYVSQQRYALALEEFRHLLELRPEMAEIWFYQAACLANLLEFYPALQALGKALELQPSNLAWREFHGQLLNESRQHLAAMISFENWFWRENQQLEKLSGVLSGLQLLGDASEIEAKLLSLPGFKETQPFRWLLTKAMGHIARGEWAPVAALFEAAARVGPLDDMQSVNLGVAYLMMGDYRQGWPHYMKRQHGRVSADALSSRHQLPQWDGSIRPGLKLLITGEQGAGDVIMAARYLRDLDTAGVLPVLALPPDQLALFSDRQEKGRIAESAAEDNDQLLSAMDAQVRLMDLLPVFAPNGPTAGKAYLEVPADQNAQWATQLGPKHRPRVGLVWQGNPSHGQDAFRSMDWRSMSLLLQVPEIDWYVFQYKTPLPLLYQDWDGLHNIGESFDSFADTAAALSQMDLLISVDTSVAHLAGAIGTPVWTLLATEGLDWRWGCIGERTPWYDSMSLIRKPFGKDWYGFVNDELVPRLAAWRQACGSFDQATAAAWCEVLAGADMVNPPYPLLATVIQRTEWPVWLRSLAWHHYANAELAQQLSTHMPVLGDSHQCALRAILSPEFAKQLALRMLTEELGYPEWYALSQLLRKGGANDMPWQQLIDKALQKYPDDPETILSKAHLYINGSNNIYDVPFWDRVETMLASEPRMGFYLALINEQKGRIDKAIRALESTVRYRGDIQVVWEQLSRLSLKMGAPLLASAAARRAISLGSGFHIKLNLVRALAESGAVAEAKNYEAKLHTAIEDDRPVETHENILELCRARRRKQLSLRPLVEQISCGIAEGSLDVTDIEQDLGWNLAWDLLKSGYYKIGWQLYSRYIIPHISRKGSLNQVEGKQCLVVQDQGLGDLIQGWRYVAAGELASGTTLAVGKDILPLLACQGLPYQLIPLDFVELQTLQHNFDVVQPVMGLYAEWESERDGAPWDGGAYLSVPDDELARYKEVLAELPGLKVGVVWAGNPALGNDHFRSTRLKDWLPLASVEGVHLISLQKDAPSNQAFQVPEITLINGGALCNSLLETAAMICNLDLVITPDTGLAHLAGALGKPVWMLNYAAHTDFRWGTTGETSIYYPTMRMFRQQGAWEPWRDVLQRVADALRELVGQHEVQE